MKPRNLIIALIAALAVFYFLTREGEKPASQTQKRSDEVQVIASRENSADYQPDLESYRLGRSSLYTVNVGVCAPRTRTSVVPLPSSENATARISFFPSANAAVGASAAATTTTASQLFF